MTLDYDNPQNLLPFLADFVTRGSEVVVDQISLLPSGEVVFEISFRGFSFSVIWSEVAPVDSISTQTTEGFVWTEKVHPSEKEKLATKVAAIRLMSNRIDLILKGDPPSWLHWRNRNPQTLNWGLGLFENISPGLIRKGKTSFYGYVLTDLHEYEGAIVLVFESDSTTLKMRLLLKELLKASSVADWGPLALEIQYDERSPEERANNNHAVENFIAFLLSRNLPLEFNLHFDHNDAPGNFLPDDFNIDFINRREMDDTAFFEMLMANTGDIAVVHTCDRECFNLFSYIASSKENWNTHTPWQLAAASDPFNHTYTPHASDQNLILGNNQLDDVLKDVKKANHGLVVFVDSCLTRMVGEDFENPIQRFRKNEKTPLVHYEIDLARNKELRQLDTFWEQLFESAADKDLPPDPKRIALIGMPPDNQNELERILADQGLSVGSYIFPTIDLPSFKQIRSCSAIFANSWAYTRKAFNSLFDVLERPVHFLDLPYGLSGTSDWIAQIVRNVSGNDNFEFALKVESELMERYESAREKLAGCRIGIFLRLSEAETELSATRRFGIPFVSFFHELGIGIDLNIFKRQNENADTQQIMEANQFSDSSNDSIHFFSSREEQRLNLERGNFSFVYTETFRDSRITKAGKIPLTLNTLQPGFAGAIKTAETLSAFVTSNFYSKYSDYLKDPYEKYAHLQENSQ